MKLFIKIFLILILVLQINTYGQQNEFTHKKIYPKGISVDYGLGRFSVQDDFFSSEKYSGTLSYFKIGWSRFHENNGFQLNLKYRRSNLGILAGFRLPGEK